MKAVFVMSWKTGSLLLHSLRIAGFFPAHSKGAIRILIGTEKFFTLVAITLFLLDPGAE